MAGAPKLPRGCPYTRSNTGHFVRVARGVTTRGDDPIFTCPLKFFQAISSLGSLSNFIPFILAIYIHSASTVTTECIHSFFICMWEITPYLEAVLDQSKYNKYLLGREDTFLRERLPFFLGGVVWMDTSEVCI
jgi:hypothetical protein